MGLISKNTSKLTYSQSHPSAIIWTVPFFPCQTCLPVQPNKTLPPLPISLMKWAVQRGARDWKLNSKSARPIVPTPWSILVWISWTRKCVSISLNNGAYLTILWRCQSIKSILDKVCDKSVNWLITTESLVFGSLEPNLIVMHLMIIKD